MNVSEQFTKKNAARTTAGVVGAVATAFSVIEFLRGTNEGPISEGLAIVAWLLFASLLLGGKKKGEATT